jgi:hypothetical protein
VNVPAPDPRRRALLLVVLTATALGCQRNDGKPGATTQAGSAAARSATLAPLRVAHVTNPFKLDGELNEPVWNAIAGRTGPFVDTTGGEARPYSDARFLWDDENLYLGLYASDENIQASVTAHDGPVWIDDAFTLRFTPDAPGAPTYQIDISASGVFTDVKKVPGGKDDATWESGMKLGVDKDGTLNDPHDQDEEWVIEAALPLRALGITPKPGVRIMIDISRCDTPKHSPSKRCGSWGTPSTPRVLELAP